MMYDGHRCRVMVWEEGSGEYAVTFDRRLVVAKAYDIELANALASALDTALPGALEEAVKLGTDRVTVALNELGRRTRRTEYEGNRR